MAGSPLLKSEGQMQKFLDSVLALLGAIVYLGLMMGAFVLIVKLFDNRSKPAVIVDRKQQSIRQYLAKIGPSLRRRYGSKPAYTVSEVRETLRARGYAASDYDCYALATYCSESDFNEYHRSIGESCSYDLMRGEVVNYFGSIFDGNTTFNANDAIDYGAAIDLHHSRSDTDNNWSDSSSVGDGGSSNYSSSDGGGSSSCADYGSSDGGGDFGGGY
jgi:uncharacterized membrane protein YgcG